MIAITLLVRDERDAIRANLEYHLAQGADLAIVTDNGSVDETQEIVTSSFTSSGTRPVRASPLAGICWVRRWWWRSGRSPTVSGRKSPRSANSATAVGGRWG